MNLIQNIAQNLFNQKNIGYAVAVIILIVFLTISKITANLIIRITDHISDRSGNRFCRELADSYQKPLRIFIDVIGIFIALRFMPIIFLNKALWIIVVKIFRSTLVVLIAWGLFNLEDSARLVTTLLAKKFDMQSNSVLFPFLSKTLRFITIALAVLIIAQEWNFSISGLLAGLGLGGLAFALAAKDMLSNMFAGIVILLDKPFKISDWIQTSDVEGTVEDINFRSVKIRTFSQAVVTVPNSTLVNGSITNFSRMGKRRVNFTISVSLHTSPNQIRSFTLKARELLSAHKGIEPETSVVVFDSIGDSRLNLMIYYYTITTEWLEFLTVKEDIYFSLMDILNDEKIEIAPPSQAIQIQEHSAES